MSQPDARIQPKPHFEVLDGLRGVAARIVVVFNMCEAWSGGDHSRQIVNHGYLAVDFSFIFSGFVVAYAYDDRWHPIDGQQRMTVWNFFKLCLIRLQPMVVMELASVHCFPPERQPIVTGTPVSRFILSHSWTAHSFRY
jgi:peptidoglycan/LPS O-acetylase OafA/YrhL